MKVSKIKSGYYYNGKIYAGVYKEPNNISILDCFIKLDLLYDWIILPQGLIAYEEVTILNTFRHGGASSHTFAQPIFQWKKIK